MKLANRVLIISLLLLAALTVLLSSNSTRIVSGASATQPETVMHVLQTSMTNSTSTTTNSTAPWWYPFIGFLTTPGVAWVQGVLTPIVGNPPTIPASTLFTIGVAAVLSLISTTAAKLLVDYDMVRSTFKEVQAWQKELNEAKKAKNEQQVSKLMKKSQAMMKQQSRASMEQFKVTAVTFGPFLVGWYTLNAVIGRAIVAYAPFPLPLTTGALSFVYWYFLCSFSINFPLMRIFGIGMSDN